MVTKLLMMYWPQMTSKQHDEITCGINGTGSPWATTFLTNSLYYRCSASNDCQTNNPRQGWMWCLRVTPPDRGQNIKMAGVSAENIVIISLTIVESHEGHLITCILTCINGARVSKFKDPPTYSFKNMTLEFRERPFIFPAFVCCYWK